ncbi:esterase-like activity of phytase family protein [Actinoallomurus acaciae]|uniref:Esterase-like activity of phytase family protein n=1 Tax=Actinoallomurus acaciae TaxID=502577 RepID=A0ABV5YD22_9ACTN
MRVISSLAGAGLLAATFLTPTTAAVAAARGGTTRACSASVDITGFSDALDKTTFDGVYVGNLSALAVDRGGRIAALSDRSSLFSLDARTLRPVGVVNLADESGAALDSEGLVVDRDGTRLITSEVEPSIRRYSRAGKILGRLAVPDALRVAPAGRATGNLTFEGLTLEPGGRTLVASMEGALSGDDADLVRFQTWRREADGRDFRLSAQYGYRVDSGLGVSDITATPDGRLLVLERGFTAGVGNTIRLYLADPRHATDVSRTENLTAGSGVRLIGKSLLADLVDCPSLGATANQPQPNPLLDNIEGITITGRAPGGRLRLLLVSDDNQSSAQITRLYSLTVRLPRG